MRLEPEYIDKLETLKHKKYSTTTEVIKKALNYYYEMKQRDNSIKIQQLLDSDFIACAEGSEDLAENYKDYLTDFMSKKYDPD